jgi:hypothetical protein
MLISTHAAAQVDNSPRMIDERHEHPSATIDAKPLQCLREISRIPDSKLAIPHLQLTREITEARQRITEGTLLNPVVKGCSPTQTTLVDRFVPVCAETLSDAVERVRGSMIISDPSRLETAIKRPSFDQDVDEGSLTLVS